MDLVTASMIGCALAGFAVGAIWLWLAFPHQIHAPAYVGVVAKLARTGDIARARKLSTAAGGAALAVMVQAMLTVAETTQFEDELLVRLSLEEAFEKARATELARFSAAPTVLVLGLGFASIPAAYAILGGHDQSLLVALLACAATAANAAALALVRGIQSTNLATVAPVTEALVATRMASLDQRPADNIRPSARGVSATARDDDAT